jgi:hypothetical protein
MRQYRHDEERILAAAIEAVARRDVGERRRGRAFSVELELEGFYPETRLRVRAHNGLDDDLVWDSCYQLWETEPTVKLDASLPSLLLVHLDEDLFASPGGRYFLRPRQL